MPSNRRAEAGREWKEQDDAFWEKFRSDNLAAMKTFVEGTGPQCALKFSQRDGHRLPEGTSLEPFLQRLDSSGVTDLSLSNLSSDGPEIGTKVAALLVAGRQFTAIALHGCRIGDDR